MNSRERFHAMMNYEPVDRGVFYMPAWWGFPKTEQRWRAEGMTDDAFDRFPVDRWERQKHWYDPNPPFQRQVIEEDERCVLYINPEGILMREFKDDPLSSMPQFVKFPVADRQEFRAFARERLQPDPAARFGEDWIDQLKALRREDAVLWVIADRWGGFFGPLRNLLGVEELCKLFYTDPAWIEEMMDTFADFIIELTGKILDVIEIDMWGFWEDMGFNLGPLIDPELVRRYMLPRYRRVTEFLRGRGVRWIALDSDGRIDLLLPIWLDAGIQFHYPFEVAAGMDVVDLRRRFGRDLRMMGGIDKRALAQGREAIDRELERVRPLVEEGGYVASIDHSVPPNVPYANFMYFMERLERMLQG